MGEIVSGLLDVSVVRINKLKDGYSWNVAVTASSSTVEALQEAKESALVIVRQLEEELSIQKPEEDDGMPF
jgi:hypothetical protein